MPDYGAAAAERDPRAVKASTDLSQVVQALGTELVDNGDGRLVGLCPFHEDGEPSFAVWQWPDGVWACGCWSCGFGPGDLFDFLMKRESLSFGAAIARVGELKRIGMADVEAIATGTREQFAGELWGTILHNARGRKAVKALLAAREIAAPVDWVMGEWGVRGVMGEVLVPHYAADQSHSPPACSASLTTSPLTGVKRRHPSDGWVPRAVTGSDLSNLYGAWRGPRVPVGTLLCEGESDTWTASWYYRDSQWRVLGLPAGAGARPRKDWVDMLRRAPLVLVPDNDAAGRAAAESWCRVIPLTAVAVLPGGTDVNSAGEAAVRTAINNASAWRGITKVRL